MASMNARSKGFSSARACGSIIMPMPRISLEFISIGTFEVPNSSYFMAFSSSISACWLETMFRESSLTCSCSAFLRATLAIVMAPWWWGAMASMNASSEYSPFFVTICLAILPEPMPIEPWPIWSWSIPPFLAMSCPPSWDPLPCCPSPAPPQALKMNVVANNSASGNARFRSVFKMTSCPYGVRLRSPCFGLAEARIRSEPEHLEDARRGRSYGAEHGGRPQSGWGSARTEPRLRPRACAQQAHEQAEEARHHGEIIRARRVAHRILVRVAPRPGYGVVPGRVPCTIDALGRGADEVQGS